MAWLSPGSSTGGGFIDLGATNNLFIAAQVSISVAPGLFGFVGFGTAQRAVILGTIASEIGGVMGANSLSISWLQVGATGRVQGFKDYGFYLNGGGRIENAGTISCFEGIGVNIVKSGANSATIITNSGLIEGATDGIRVNSDATFGVTLTNSGVLQGGTAAYQDVSTAAHQDYITNTGSVIGDVLLGNGDDLFDGRLGNHQGLLDGGAGNDRLYTGSGSQSLFGGDGNDTMIGGAGADSFFGQDGFDIVSYSSATSRVVASLATEGTVGDAAGDVFKFIGVVDVEGLRGSAFNDELTGDGLANRLLGGAGNDTLNGGLGIDTLFGQTGQDTFVFNTRPNTATNFDRITDYVVADDRVRLDDAVFVGVGPVGALTAEAFRINATGLAGDPTDRIIYNTANGGLYFDSNGTAFGGSVRFAILTPGLAMTADEFTIF